MSKYYLEEVQLEVVKEPVFCLVCKKQILMLQKSKGDVNPTYCDKCVANILNF